MTSYIEVGLLSDATFSFGEGAAGEVDVEIAHDEYGLPFLPGRTLRGLLRESWLAMALHFPEYGAPAREVQGPAGDLTPGGVS
ncbi:MAG: RAMP superfamily CRISPR-associated protein, partial [Actinomycetota bacterium]